MPASTSAPGFPCPSCGARVALPVAMVGVNVNCSSCGATHAVTSELLAAARGEATGSQPRQASARRDWRTAPPPEPAPPPPETPASPETPAIPAGRPLQPLPQASADADAATSPILAGIPLSQAANAPSGTRGTAAGADLAGVPTGARIVAGIPHHAEQSFDPADINRSKIVAQSQGAAWRQDILASTMGLAETRGRKLALWSTGLFAFGIGVLIAGSDVPNLIEGLLDNPLGAGLLLGTPLAALACAWFLQARARGIGVLICGLVIPLALYVELWEGLKAAPLGLHLYLPMLVGSYGLASAAREFPHIEKIRNAAALAGLGLIGVMIWLLVQVSNVGIGAAAFGQPMTFQFALLCVPPGIAVYNHFAESENVALATPVSFWLIWIVEPALLLSMILGVEFLQMVALEAVLLGPPFIAGAGLRDLVVAAEFERQLREHVGVEAMAAGRGTIEERLLLLDHQLDAGRISPEQYEARKNQILRDATA